MGVWCSSLCQRCRRLEYKVNYTPKEEYNKIHSEDEDRYDDRNSAPSPQAKQSSIILQGQACMSLFAVGLTSIYDGNSRGDLWPTATQSDMFCNIILEFFLAVWPLFCHLANSELSNSFSINHFLPNMSRVGFFCLWLRLTDHLICY